MSQKGELLASRLRRASAATDYAALKQRALSLSAASATTAGRLRSTERKTRQAHRAQRREEWRKAWVVGGRRMAAEAAELQAEVDRGLLLTGAWAWEQCCVAWAWVWRARRRAGMCSGGREGY